MAPALPVRSDALHVALCVPVLQAFVVGIVSLLNLLVLQLTYTENFRFYAVTGGCGCYILVVNTK